jgi:hypothetical protein
MKMPVWVTLKDVPREYWSNAMDITESLGPVLGKNRSNAHLNDQKFCIALTAREPFPLKVEVMNPVNGKTSHFMVDYNNLPIRCRHCLSTTYLVRECPIVKRDGARESVVRGGLGEGERDKQKTNVGEGRAGSKGTRKEGGSAETGMKEQIQSIGKLRREGAATEQGGGRTQDRHIPRVSNPGRNEKVWGKSHGERRSVEETTQSTIDMVLGKLCFIRQGLQTTKSKFQRYQNWLK